MRYEGKKGDRKKEEGHGWKQGGKKGEEKQIGGEKEEGRRE